MPTLYNLYLCILPISLLAQDYDYRDETDSKCDCPVQHIPSSTQTMALKSPNFPEPPCRNTNCTWIFEPSNHSFIMLYLESFGTQALEAGLNITEIVEDHGVNYTIPRTRLTGEFANPHKFSFSSSVGTWLIVNFRTVGYWRSAGFHMQMRRATLSQPHCSYPLVHLTDSMSPQIFKSTQYIHYVFKACAMLLIGPKGSTMKFTRLDTGEFPKYKVVDKRIALAYDFLPQCIDLYKTTNYREDKRNVNAVEEYTSFSNEVLLFICQNDTIDNYWQQLEYKFQVELRPPRCGCPTPLSNSNAANNEVMLTETPVTVSSADFNHEYNACFNSPCYASFKFETKKPGQKMFLRVQQKRYYGSNFKVNIDTNGDPKYAFESRPQDSVWDITTAAELISIKTGKEPYNITAYVINVSQECHCFPGTDSELTVADADTGNFVLNFNSTSCTVIDCWIEFLPKPGKQLWIQTFYDLMLSSPNVEISNDKGEYRNFFYGERSSPGQYVSDVYPENGLSTMMHIRHHFATQGALLNVSYEWSEECKCEAIPELEVTEVWQTLRSPRYPKNYCNNLNCTYVLSSPSDTFIRIEIKDLHTEEFRDKLIVYYANQTQFQMWTGVIKERLELFSSNKVYLEFTSDHSDTSSGFELAYSYYETTETRSSNHWLILTFLFIGTLFGIIGGFLYAKRRYPALMPAYMSTISFDTRDIRNYSDYVY